MARLAPIHWTISGRPFAVADWSCNSTAAGGFDQMRGIVAGVNADTLRSLTMQGAPVSGFTEYGQCIFEGRLAARPKLQQAGAASIVASGHVAEAVKRNSRLLLYSTNGSIFQDARLPPYLRDPDSGADGWSAMLYIPEGNLRRIKGTVVNRMRVQVADDPSAPAITIYDQTAGGFHDIDVMLPKNTTILLLTSDATPPIASDTTKLETSPLPVLFSSLYPGWLNKGSIDWVYTGSPLAWILGLQVWGETTNDVVFSEVAARVVADRLGWDPSGVFDMGATDIRPLDWFGSWDQMLAYIASFDQARWGVYNDEHGYGSRLEFGPFGRRHWEVSSAGAAWDLEPLEVFNRVIVAYVSADGRDNQFIVDADPDPLASVGLTNELRLNMNDRQGGLDLVARYATSTLAHVSQQQYAGRISLVSAMDVASGMDAPYEIRGGDLVTIRDFNGSEALTVRAADVEYAPGVVTVGVSESAVAIAEVMGAGATSPPPPGDLPPSAPVQDRTSRPSSSQPNTGATGGTFWERHHGRWGSF